MTNLAKSMLAVVLLAATVATAQAPKDGTFDLSSRGGGVECPLDKPPVWRVYCEGRIGWAAS